MVQAQVETEAAVEKKAAHSRTKTAVKYLKKTRNPLVQGRKLLGRNILQDEEVSAFPTPPAVR